MVRGRFATSISCIDGRIQGPLSAWIRGAFGVDYVDTITEPGADKRMSMPEIAGQLRAKAVISVRAHGSRTIVVSGHDDCAANPVPEAAHRGQIAAAAAVAASWGTGAEIVGAWVGPGGAVSRV